MQDKANANVSTIEDCRNKPQYTVNEVTKMTGVTKAKLVDYDSKGLLCPARVTKGIGQEWRMYSESDLDRLGKILVLLAYGFKIEEIKLMLDSSQADIFQMVASKLEELKREEWRLRNLLLFAKFVNIANTELFSGLLHGPTDIDDFANAVRAADEYSIAMRRISRLSDEELEKMLGELDDIVSQFVFVDPEVGFAGEERVIDRFLDWWKRSVSLSSEVGYLEFWAIFEDDNIIVSKVEEVGGETAAANLQMLVFYSCMKRLMIDTQNQIKSMATLSETDVIAAISELQTVVDEICECMGAAAFGVDAAERLELANSVLDYMEGILGDDELRNYIDPEGSIALVVKDIEQARRLLTLKKD